MSLSWTAVTDANGYKVEYRKGTSGSWLHAGYAGSRNYYTVSRLSCDTAYQFRVRARGDGSPYSYTYGDPSSTVSETTDACLAPAPTGFKVTSDTQTSVNLSWTAVTDAGAYKVEYRKGTSGSWLHATYVFSGASARVGSLDCNTSYQFQVRTRGDGSPYSYTYGDPSSSVTEATDLCSPDAPGGLKATDKSDTTVTLSWDAVTDAAAYKVEYRESGEAIWLHATYVFSGTSTTVGSLSSSTTYEFRVRSRGDGDPFSLLYGEPSSTVSQTTEAPTISAPTGLKVTSDTDTSVTLSWTAVSEAGAYKVEYRRSDTSDWLHANYVYTGTSNTVDKLDCNTEYQFRVRARGDGSPYSLTYSVPSSHVTETTDGCPPAPAPTGLAVTGSTENSVSLEWNPVPDAYRYQLEQREGIAGSWTDVGSETGATSQTATGLDCNTTYYFRVSARGGGSPYSSAYGTASSSVSKLTGTCTISSPTGLRSVASGEDAVSLTWGAVSGADKYRVERSPEGADEWAVLSEEVATTSYADSGLLCGTEYDFRVSAYSNAKMSWSAPSASTSATTSPCPANPEFAAGQYEVSVSESLATKSKVLRVKASDPDGGGLNYSIAGGDPAGVFTIGRQSGQITTADNLDFEVAANYELTVVAEDRQDSSLQDTTTVSISVANVNESPTFDPNSYGFAIPLKSRNSSNRVLVGGVRAYDQDFEDIVTYSITTGNTSNIFSIDGVGRLWADPSALPSTATNYALSIRASDGDGHTDDAKIGVKLTNLPIATLRLNQDRFNEGGEITATISLTNRGSTPDADLPDFKLQVRQLASASSSDGVQGSALALPSYDVDFPIGTSSVRKSVSITQIPNTTRIQLVLSTSGDNASKALTSNGAIPVVVNDKDIAIGETQTGDWGILEPLTASPSTSLEEPNVREFSLRVPQNAGNRNVRIDLSSGDRDPVLLLKDSSGNALEWNDDGGLGLDARIVRHLTPGEYKVAAHTQWGGDDGKFQLGVSYSEDPLTDPDNETAGIVTENPRREISVESHTFTSSPSWKNKDCSASITSARQGDIVCIEVKGTDFEEGNQALAVLLTSADHQLRDIPQGAVALEYVNATTMRGMWVAQRLSRYAQSSSGPTPYRVAIVGYDTLSNELPVSPPLADKTSGAQGAQDSYETAKELLKQLGFEDPDVVFETLWILYGEGTDYEGPQDFASEFAEGAIQGEWGINSNPNRGIAYFAGWMIIGFIPVVDIGPDVRDFFAFEVFKCSSWKCRFSLSGLGSDLIDAVAIIPGIGKVGDVPQAGKIVKNATESNAVGELGRSLKHVPEHAKNILNDKRGYWADNYFARGRKIEQNLFEQFQRGNSHLLNLNARIAPNFRGIDYFDNRLNVAISVKTIDPDAKRYKNSAGAFNPNAFEGTVKRYLNELKKVDPYDLYKRAMDHNVELNGMFLENPAFSSRHIDMVIPENPSTEVTASLRKLKAYVEDQDVGLNFYTTSKSGGNPFIHLPIGP